MVRSRQDTPQTVALAFPSKTLSLANPEDYDVVVAELASNYLAVARVSEQVAFFSITGFFVFYLQMLRWAFCLYAIPVILVVNAIQWPLCRARGTAFHLWGQEVARLLAAPFVALHAGDISAFKFVTLRGGVRLLIYLRLGRTLTAVTERIQEEGIQRFVQAPQAALAEQRWPRRWDALIEDLRQILSRKLGLAFWSSLAGAAGLFELLKEAAELLPKETLTNASTYAKPILSLGLLSFGDPSFSLANKWELLIAYVLWVIATNFIVMRAVLTQTDTDAVERRALSRLQLKAPIEWPLDLIGAMLFLIVAFVPSLHGVSTADIPAQIALFAVFLSLPGYALIRRLRTCAARAPCPNSRRFE